MRVAVVVFAARPRSPVLSLAEAVAKGIQNQGHQVDIIDGRTEQSRKLIMYQYIVLGTEQTSFFGKINEKIGYFLASQGTVQGKKAFAFVSKKMMGAPQALLRLMSVMEKEGILVKNSAILDNKAYAFEMGKTLHIDK